MNCMNIGMHGATIKKNCLQTFHFWWKSDNYSTLTCAYVCVCVCVRARARAQLDRTKYVGTKKYFNHCTCLVLRFTNVRKCPQECHTAVFVLVLSRMYFKRSLNTLFSFVIHVGWKLQVFSCFCFISGCFLYSGTPLIRIYWDGEPSGYAQNPENWIFI